MKDRNEYVAMLVLEKNIGIDENFVSKAGPLKTGKNIEGFTSLYVRKGELKTVNTEELEKTLLNLVMKKKIKDYHITNKLRQGV